MARLIAAAVPLFVATTAVSARLKHKAAMDIGRVLAPLAGFGIGLGIARLTGDPAEYAAAIDAGIAGKADYQTKLTVAADHMPMTAAILTSGIVANKKIES